MRLGDHMMLIQLQLSSVTPPTRKSSTSTSQQSSKSNETYLPKPNVNVPSTSDTAVQSSSSSSSSSSGSSSNNININTSSSSSSSTSSSGGGGGSSVDPDISLPNLTLINSKLNTLLHKNNENLNALKRKFNSGDEDASVKKTKPDDDNKSKYFKDLNLKNVLLNVSEPSTSDAKSTKYSDMMKESTGESIKVQANQELQAKKSKILSQIIENVRKISENTNEMTQAIEGKVCDKETVSDNGSKCNVTCTCSNKSGDNLDNSVKSSESAALDTKALAEASRNLTQTLKQLSSEALTCRSENAEVRIFFICYFRSHFQKPSTFHVF